METSPAPHRLVPLLRPCITGCVLLILLLPLSFPLFAQSADLRGLKTVVGKLAGESVVVGKQYAVLIAVDKYSSWITLSNPVKDAKEIKAILARRYYVTDFLELYDEAATKAGIIRLFNKLIGAAKPEDSIFIFYAGHGYLDRTSNTGFWIPVDGGLDLDEQENWLPNSQIRGFISNMKARHVALIADSCFSGDILNPSRGLAPTISDEYFKNAYARISRQVLTSGASESVPDKSPFTQQLKLALEGNTSPYLDPLMLYSQIRLGVKGTTPLFGDLKDSGHQEGSSFLLFLKPAGGQQGAPNEAGPAATMKIAKAYGAATIETDAPGTLFLDGVSQGQIPVGSVATIENLAVGPHQLELLYDDGERSTQTITVKMGKNSAVEFSRPARTAPAAAPAETKSAAEPQTVLDGKPLPVASIKIDGNFDDWQRVPPVVVSSLGPDDNRSIRKVFLAMDAESLFIKLDIADVTPSSFLHLHNFDESPGRRMGGLAAGQETLPGRFYAIRIDAGESENNLNVLLFHHTHNNAFGWYSALGVREKGNLRFLTTWYLEAPCRFQMRGSSVEAAILLKRIANSLAGFGPAKQYRVAGWTATGMNPLEDLRETEAGIFSIETTPPAKPVSDIKPLEEPREAQAGASQAELASGT